MSLWDPHNLHVAFTCIEMRCYKSDSWACMHERQVWQMGETFHVCTKTNKVDVELSFLKSIHI
jgi:hypothetical protein